MDNFARKFILSINISGFLTFCFLIYTLIRPWFFKYYPSPTELERPRKLVSEYGKTALDYFKTYHDKYLIYDHDYDLLQIPGALMKVIKP